MLRIDMYIRIEFILESIVVAAESELIESVEIMNETASLSSIDKVESIEQIEHIFFAN